MKIKRWHIWVGFTISAVFLFLAFRNVDFKLVWKYLQVGNFWWLIPGLAIYFLGVFFRSVRWQFLLKPIKKVSVRTLFPIINIGYMGNNVYPARAGEILRAIVLKRKENISASATIATIIVERIFDALVVLAFVLFNLKQFSKAVTNKYLGTVVENLALIGSLIFIFILIGFILIAIFPENAKKIVIWIKEHLIPLKWKEGFKNLAFRFLEGLDSLKSPLDVISILVITAVIWTCETGLYWTVMKALNLSLGFQILMLLNGVINLVLLIPAAPGGLGTFDAASRTMLEAFALNAELAIGFTLILRIVLWLPITILGFIYFLNEGFRWNIDIKKIEEEASLKQ
jgi:uncharacterized protein (TIRG00374 family)